MMLMGHLHNLMSLQDYDKVRCIMMRLMGITIPHWKTIRKARENIRNMLNMRMIYRLSLFDNKCYSLSLKNTIALVS
jgi:hypothetical protein